MQLISGGWVTYDLWPTFTKEKQSRCEGLEVKQADSAWGLIYSFNDLVFSEIHNVDQRSMNHIAWGLLYL